MHTVIRTYEVTDAAELSRRVQDGFVPIVREVDGFVGYYVIDAGGGKLATVTVCRDKAGADETTARAADWVTENIAELVTSGPSVVEGEVTASSDVR